MATARLVKYDDTSLDHSVRPNLTSVSNREEVIAEVSATDIDSFELPAQIRMSHRDFRLFLVALEDDKEPNDALKAAAERYKQQYG